MCQPFRVLRLLGLALLAACSGLAGSAFAAADEAPRRDFAWQVPEAPLRLFVLPARSQPHSLLVELDAACRQSCKGVRAGDAAGQPLPVSSIRVGEQLLAVELQLGAEQLAQLRTVAERPPPAGGYGPGAAALAGAIQLYLLPEIPVDQPDLAPGRTPVALGCRYQRLMARPTTPAEYRFYEGKIDPPEYSLSASSFSDLQRDRILREPGFGRSRRGQPENAPVSLQLELEALLVVARPQALQFAVKGTNAGAWFLYVDGRDYCGWVGAGNDGEYRSGPALELAPGLHLLQVRGLLDDEEQLPLLYYRASGGNEVFRPLETERLCASLSPAGLAREELNGPLAPGLRLTPRQLFAFSDTGSVLGVFQVADLSRQLQGRPLLRRDFEVGDDHRQIADATFTAFLGGAQPQPLRYRLQDDNGTDRTLEWSFRWDTRAANNVNVRLDPGPLPLGEPAEGPLAIPYRLDFPYELQHLLYRDGVLAVRQRDVAGNVLREARQAIPKSPYERRVTLADLPVDTACVELQVELGRIAASLPLKVYLVASRHDPRLFAPGGDRLRYADGYAVCRRPVPPPARPEARSVHVARLAVLDDFIGGPGHYLDDLPPETWFATTASGLRVDYLPLDRRSLAGDLASSRKFSALAQALRGSPEALVLALGAADLAAGMDLRDFRAQLEFLVQACLAQGCEPILATLPITGADSHDRLRPYALMVKELGAFYRLQVIDFYSASLLRGPSGVDEFYWLDKAHRIRSATPNAEGRRWFLTQLLAAVQSPNAEP